MLLHIIAPDPYEGNAHRHTAVGLPPTGHEQRGISGGVIATGYVCGFASLFIFPPALALAGIVIGIVCLVRERLGHGIVLLIVSTMCGLLGMSVGATVWMQVFNKWLTMQTQTSTTITRDDSAPTSRPLEPPGIPINTNPETMINNLSPASSDAIEAANASPTSYTPGQLDQMVQAGALWNGHHFIPFDIEHYPGDGVTLPIGFHLYIIGDAGFWELMQGRSDKYFLILMELPASAVGCITYTAPPKRYREMDMNSVMVSGEYIGVSQVSQYGIIPNGMPVIYPCKIEQVLDSFGDDMSR